jgi:hypothetical protein
LLAQVIEAEFVAGAVGNIAAVGLPLLVVRGPFRQQANATAQRLVNRLEQLEVAAREIAIRRHDMNGALGDRSQKRRQSSRQRLTFAGLHFGNATPRHRQSGT